MPVEFYNIDMSPFGRGVWMTLEALGVDYVIREISLMKQENKTAEYTVISPLQKIPAIKDGEFTLAESRAIATYLCTKYGSSDNKLYPSNIEARGRVDMLLYMNCTWFGKIMEYLKVGQVVRRTGLPDKEQVNLAHEVLADHEKFLNKTLYLASEHMTIADFFAYILIGMLDLLEFNDYGKYPKLTAWMKKMSQLPYHKKTCEEPLEKIKAFYQEALKDATSK